MMEKRRGFGTFGGVFVPNILTILGVIMYLRMGWVVGNAGLKSTLIILLIANLITLFTAFSISSIATNMRIKGGGAYYLISRSLGAEVGGSVGIPLYLAQTLVISLYIVGFTESLSLLFPDLPAVGINLSVLVILTTIALISTGLVIKIQYVILGVIVLSLFSFFLGSPVHFEDIHLNSAYEMGYDFWSVFAVFFPAVTGILSGVSLSGDLRDPAKSIPAGTIYSVIAGAVVYFMIAIWFSMSASPDELVRNNLIMITMARWGPLIYAGIWGATLSSALANILAAPRTLQALAVDGLVFRVLKRGRGEQNEPILATFITFVLVGAVLLFGELNTIAPVLTMFFLITYGFINIISFLEGLIKRPGFRPTFRVHWAVSFAGAAGCIWAMFLINAVACIAGFAFVFVIYLVLKRIQIEESWGDFRRGIWSSLIQFSLQILERSSDHSVAWRPSLLLTGKDLIYKQKLIQIAFGLTEKSGFLTCINLHRSGEYDAEQLEYGTREFKKMLREKRISAFYRNAVVDNYLSGQLMASQLHGIGEFKHNTILLDWAEVTGGGVADESTASVNQLRLMRFYSDLNHSLLLLNINPGIQRSGYQKVDLWWDPGQKNGSFMLVLAHLLASSSFWRDMKLHIKTVVLRDKLKQTYELLEALVNRSRIRAKISVLHPDSDQEADLGIQFEKIQKKHQRKQRRLESIRKLIKYFGREFNKESDESERFQKAAYGSTNEEDSEKIEERGAGDDAIKEKLSEQVQDRDDFIIQKNISRIIIENSKQADLVMLGFNIPSKGNEKKYIEKMEALLEELPDTLLINCPFDFDLID